MKVYGFLYNPMIEESAYATISLHKTKNGAKKAMKIHKKEKLKKWKEFLEEDKLNKFYKNFEDWHVKEIEVQTN